MRVELPSPLLALLARLGLTKPKGDHKAGGLVHVEGLAGEKAGEAESGVSKGTLLGEDGVLLAGLGYAGQDKTTQQKNKAEQENIDRFLSQAGQERRPSRPGAQSPARRKSNEDQGASRPEQDRSSRTEEAFLKDERAKERENAIHRDLERAEATRNRSEAEEERQRDRDGQGRRQDRGQGQESGQGGQDEEQDRRRDKEAKQLADEDLLGATPIASLPQDPVRDASTRRAYGLKELDALGEAHRCHGKTENGDRCLRKPVKGTPYCPEHAHGSPS